MPYVDDNLLNEDEQSGGPSVPGGGQSNLQSANPNLTATGQQKTPGRFANLNEYLRVNQPQEFGTQAAGKIDQDINKGQQTVDNAQQEFKSRADANTVTDSQGLIGKVATDPVNIAVDDYAKLRDAEYKGPKTLNDAGDLYSQVQGATRAATGKAKASGSESGRFALLDSYFGRPTYSQGQKSLDNLLIQNDASSRQAFDQVRANADTLAQNAKTAVAGLEQYGGQAQAKTKKTRDEARGALGIDDAGNVLPTDSFNPPGNGNVGIGGGPAPLPSGGGAAIQQLLMQLDQAIGARQNRTNLPTTAQGLGLNGEDLSVGAKFIDPWTGARELAPAGSTLGLDPFGNNYYSATDASAYNRGNIATTDQAARLKALEGLAGLDANSLVSNIDEAGTAPGEFTFNKEKFLTDLAARRQELQRKAYQTGLEYEQRANTKSPDADPGLEEGRQKIVRSDYEQSLKNLLKNYGIA